MKNNLIRKTRRTIFLVLDIINCNGLKASAIMSCFSKRKNAIEYAKKYFHIKNNFFYNDKEDRIQIYKLELDNDKYIDKFYFVYEVIDDGTITNIKHFNNKKDSLKYVFKYYSSNLVNNKESIYKSKDRRYFSIKNDVYMVKISKIILDKD